MSTSGYAACRKAYVGLLGLLFVLGIGSGLYAGENFLVDTFEDYGRGTSVVGLNGWTGSSDSCDVFGTNYSYSGQYSAVHQGGDSNVLRLAGAVTNTITGNGGEAGEVWVDTMIAMVPWSGDPIAVPVVPADVQAACTVNTNGNLMIYHLDHWDSGNPKWTEIPETASFGLTSSWARITFHFDYSRTDIDATYPIEYDTYFFQVMCNGSLISNSLASVTNHGPIYTYGQNGTWFAIANTADPGRTNRLTSLAISDSGLLDDVQVTSINPMSATNWTIAASAGMGATIVPSGNVFVPQGNDKTFTISNSPLYIVTNVVVDGVCVGAVSSYTFYDVSASHTIRALARLGFTAMGTPLSWLEQFDLDEVDDEIDIEPDGHKTWEEYVMGTDPTNAASVCKVLSVDLYGSSNLVSWYATTNSGVTNVFYVQRSTNLVTDWETKSDAIPRAGDGTNKWWDTALPPTNTIFYRPVTIWQVQ